MKNENPVSLGSSRIMGLFEPLKEEFKNNLLKFSGITDSLPENLKKLLNFKADISPKDISALLQYSRKPEDWLKICFDSEQNPDINHEMLWISGLEKFNNSALYLENLGYFYFQRSRLHKSLEYLSKSHALENSFFALSLAIAAAYALTQYHLVLEYFLKLDEKERNRLNEELLMKVATAALHQENYNLSLKIFRDIQKKNQVKPLPDLKNFLLGKFGSEMEMKTWSKQKFNEEKSGVEIAKMSIDDCITYASILIHEDKFEHALEYLLEVKKQKFSE